jgi:formylglycine-generating enzyme required for sulfatase activity
MRAAIARRNSHGLVLPAVLLAGLTVTLGLQTGLVRLPHANTADVPETVVVPAVPYTYRATGAFLQAGAVVDGPLVTLAAPAPLEIMTYQVSVGDYDRCVEADACRPAQPRRRGGNANLPVTGISYDDAVRYADWVSEQTGETWRLPSVAEWVQAAGSRASDEALGLEANAANPAERWIATYEKEAAAAADGPAEPLPRGVGGINEFGVADLAGAVWEWTSTCDGRTTLDAGGKVIRQLDACGAHYLEGRHRAVMTNFVRDAAAGGCSTGVPPDNLGFRLVRDRGWFGSAVDAVRAWLA